MATVFYPAIVEKSATGFSLFFPDLPGCVTAGETLDDVAQSAEEAIASHLLLLHELGEPIPPASTLDDVVHDPDVREVARLRVQTKMPGKAVRINVMLDETVLNAIDRVASNRSAFLNKAAAAMLANRIRVTVGGMDAKRPLRSKGVRRTRKPAEQSSNRETIREPHD